MGKIFDALEKTAKYNKKSLRDGNKRGRGIDQRHKMVVEAKKKIVKMPEVDKVIRISDKKGSGLESTIDQNLVAFHNPRSIEADLFKKLRTNILFPVSEKPPKTVLVCSALPGDGKSFVSLNLAISIANGIEENVLLIDCDMRKPSIHKAFGQKESPGLSEYLSGLEDAAKIIKKTPLQKLSIIPSGKPPVNPTELLSSKKLRELLIEVKKQKDDRYIIIDSPPPAMAPETHVIEKYVDGIVFVVKAGKTPRKAVAEVVEQFDKKKIIGVVLNHAGQKAKKYYGYNKSYYE